MGKSLANFDLDGTYTSINLVDVKTFSVSIYLLLPAMFLTYASVNYQLYTYYLLLSKTCHLVKGFSAVINFLLLSKKLHCPNA